MKKHVIGVFIFISLVACYLTYEIIYREDMNRDWKVVREELLRDCDYVDRDLATDVYVKLEMQYRLELDAQIRSVQESDPVLKNYYVITKVDDKDHYYSCFFEWAGELSGGNALVAYKSVSGDIIIEKTVGPLIMQD